MNAKLLDTVAVALKEMFVGDSERILEELEKSRNHKLKVTLSVALDASSPASHAQLKIRYTPEAVTDSRSILGEDPNQLGMPLYGDVVDPNLEDRMGEQPVVVKRKRGRPEGSKNKKKKQSVADPVEPVVETAEQPVDGLNPIIDPEPEAE